MRRDNGMKIFLWSMFSLWLDESRSLHVVHVGPEPLLGEHLHGQSFVPLFTSFGVFALLQQQKRYSLFIHTPLKHNVTQLYWHSSLKSSTIQWQDCILFRAIQNVTVGNVRYFALSEGAMFKFDWFFRISITFLTR